MKFEYIILPPSKFLIKIYHGLKRKINLIKWLKRLNPHDYIVKGLNWFKIF